MNCLTRANWLNGKTVLAVALLAGAVGMSGAAMAAESANDLAQRILQTTGVQGGAVVHVGCGDGALIAALAARDGFLVHGLDADAKNVEAARQRLQKQGRYGKATVERWSGAQLPYIDNLINLVIAEGLGALELSEVVRVLAPHGVAYFKHDGKWTKTVKPRPAEIDEWTHFLHDATNNAVAHDTVVGPPRRLQWVGGPRYARHHDRLSSVNAVVTAGGRVFYIFDEGPTASILSAASWKLIARDAFNGTILWKRDIKNWFTHLWPLKSGPAQLPRRLVASGDRVYVTLDFDGPLLALDAATGKTVLTFKSTRATEEAVLADDVLVALVNDAADKADYDGRERFRKGYNEVFWDQTARRIAAFRADAEEPLWTERQVVLPGTLAADGKRVVFHNGASVVCLDQKTGEQIWRSEPVERSPEIRAFYTPTLVLHGDVVLFSGGESAGQQTGSWYEKGKDSMTALSLKDGQELWVSYHPPSGYRSSEDLLVAGGLVWTGETLSGRASGAFTGRDPLTGEVKSAFEPDVDTYWFHHRCYRGKATEKFLLMSRAGIEFIDFREKTWDPNHWVRGACLYGVMPANGLIYAPQHPCACYLESKLYGFNALAPASAKGEARRVKSERLEKGPAFDAMKNEKSKIENGEEWPTFRGNAARSGSAATAVPTALKSAWKTELGGKLTAPVIAEGLVFVAAVDEHTLHALNASSGERRWQFTAGGRIDSPPTIHQGRAIFGSADGYVYCLRAADGALAWRFRGGPADRRTMAFEQLESVWPVPGNVLVKDGVAYCVAGRSMFLDGGLRLLRLDAATGRLLSETVMDDKAPEAGKKLQDYVSWLNMPPALPDVLSSVGKRVYMRSQAFELDGTRLPLKPMPKGGDADAGAPTPTQNPEFAHLFCPTGYLDGTYWHRTYQVYGSQFISGWCGYFLAGKASPAGRLLVFDDDKVYGFGRKPQYYRWTTPIEHHLYSADKLTAGAPAASQPTTTAKRSCVSVANSKSLNPKGQALTVEAWVKADQPGGVILARGGGSQGYALYLKGGRPQFAIRVGGTLTAASAPQRVVGRWAHLTGVLTADKELRIYVDGKHAATAKAPALVGGNPQEALEIGLDDGSSVGDYEGAFGFAGVIDEVRVQYRALSDAEVEQRAKSTDALDAGAAVVLALAFDNGKAADASANQNNGKVEGAKAVKGKRGQALKFTGAGVPSSKDFKIKHDWASDLPLFARGMVLAGGTLFVAGPEDIIDEEQAYKQYAEPEVQRRLAEQAAIFAGEKGARLWAVSVGDGAKLSELPLDSPPVWDGLAAANNKLYLTDMKGAVICLAGAK